MVLLTAVTTTALGYRLTHSATAETEATPRPVAQSTPGVISLPTASSLPPGTTGTEPGEAAVTSDGESRVLAAERTAREWLTAYMTRPGGVTDVSWRGRVGTRTTADLMDRPVPLPPTLKTRQTPWQVRSIELHTVSGLPVDTPSRKSFGYRVALIDGPTVNTWIVVYLGADDSWTVGDVDIRV